MASGNGGTGTIKNANYSFFIFGAASHIKLSYFMKVMCFAFWATDFNVGCVSYGRNSVLMDGFSVLRC